MFTASRSPAGGKDWDLSVDLNLPVAHHMHCKGITCIAKASNKGTRGVCDMAMDALLTPF